MARASVDGSGEQPHPTMFQVIQCPNISYRRAVFTTIVLYTCWQIFATVVFDPLLDWADEEWEALSDKEKEEVQNMEEDEPMLFLPFPFTTKEVKQPPYRGSDPEWEMFVKVNQDTKLQKEIKCESTTWTCVPSVANTL